MRIRWSAVVSFAILAANLAGVEASAQTSVTYGRVTAVRQVDLHNPGAQAAGTLVGGALGLASGSGQSRSNRALRAIGGGAVGGSVGAAAGSGTGFEYTVLIGGTNTIRMVTEQAGLRVGDCVSVERGTHNNIRLAADARCEAAARTPVPASDQAEADACAAAKNQLLQANTDADFDRAERRMRLLCGD